MKDVWKVFILIACVVVTVTAIVGYVEGVKVAVSIFKLFIGIIALESGCMIAGWWCE